MFYQTVQKRFRKSPYKLFVKPLQK
jgi:hypothetical protein